MLTTPQQTAIDPWETFVSRGLVARENIERNLWKLAEVCANVEAEYGDGSASKFGGEIGLSKRRVQELAQTWREWERRDRSRILSVKHHTIALRAPDPQEIIKRAEDSSWSTRQLEAQVAKAEIDRDLRDMNMEGETLVDAVPSVTVKRRVCPTCDGEGEIYERIEDDRTDDERSGTAAEAEEVERAAATGWHHAGDRAEVREPAPSRMGG